MTPKPKLLFVDDEPEILDFLVAVFRDCDSSTAPYAEAALTLLRRERFDVLITDIKMPGGDGLSLMNSAKAIWPGLPVIMITGHYQEIPEGVEEKVQHWILKPFSVETIRAAVMESLRFSSRENTSRTSGPKWTE